MDQQRVQKEKQDRELVQILKICRDQEKTLIKCEKDLENILFQSKMLITLINDLLDLAKLETMNFKFNDEYFDYNQLIKQAFTTVKH